jgi:hypothetical protein
MTITDLINEARADLLNDLATPYLWSDTQLTRFANEAIVEACQRAPLIARVSTVSIVAGTATYAINGTIRQLLYAKLALSLSPLLQTTDAELSMRVSTDWRLREGTPTHYLKAGHRLTLYPKPVVNDTLALSTSNVPDDAFDLDEDIDAVYHKPLLFYIAYKALMMNDADTYNPLKAADFLRMFTEVFGARKTAKYDQVELPMYGTLISGRMA